MKEAKDYIYDLPAGYTMPVEIRKKLDTFVDNTMLTNYEAQQLVDLHIELTEDFVVRQLKYFKGILYKFTAFCATVIVALGIAIWMNR